MSEVKRMRRLVAPGEAICNVQHFECVDFLRDIYECARACVHLHMCTVLSAVLALECISPCNAKRSGVRV